MTQAPTKSEEEKKVQQRKVERDNIFLDILYNIVVQMPILAISWVISRFDWD
jgi:hypothetical protein